MTTTHRFKLLVAASLLLAPAASATESVLPSLAASAPVEQTPLVLGAPPAWGLMALGAAVVFLTIARRLRKTTVTERVFRR